MTIEGGSLIIDVCVPLILQFSLSAVTLSLFSTPPWAQPGFVFCHALAMVSEHESPLAVSVMRHFLG